MREEGSPCGLHLQLMGVCVRVCFGTSSYRYISVHHSLKHYGQWSSFVYSITTLNLANIDRMFGINRPYLTVRPKVCVCVCNIVCIVNFGGIRSHLNLLAHHESTSMVNLGCCPFVAKRRMRTEEEEKEEDT